ncbi:riboflavin synthase [Candidatus Contubernalis alkaliaceticus]|uniref:riboflavin synthase n=1 Tax=Candidatus Contubernalis alkaliaceticus TaxID=338645 RepID=UPI001F4BE910|nr:riboflavin synthase [Candidatus Contubernalis alkalaceticus]UNC92780.1 riboflavin synthase [Candidatus Contubernalis alkalaceticus]
MFTGIVEELGVIQGLELDSSNPALAINAQIILSDVKIGDSISVNGVCLTVISFDSSLFKVEVMPETLRNTGLYELKRGDRVNLERALALGDRLGGHLVSGHIDGVGTIRKKNRESNALVIEINAPPEIMKYAVPKGSMAVDGISLTIVQVKGDSFTVSLIPHTAENTTLGFKAAGSQVNLEGDMIGKYVENFMSARRKEDSPSRGLTMNDLADNGFL